MGKPSFQPTYGHNAASRNSAMGPNTHAEDPGSSTPPSTARPAGVSQEVKLMPTAHSEGQSAGYRKVKA